MISLVLVFMKNFSRDPDRSIPLGCYALCHSFYATLRNGLWDDPAEATAGAVYKAFAKQVDRYEMHPSAAIYLTWRYSYLKCFLLIGLLWAAASANSWRPDRTWWDDFVKELPEEIQAERFETFVVIMSWWNTAPMYLWLSAFCVVLVAIFLAAPSRVLKYQNRHLSRYLVWGAWLWNFVVPFVFLLVFPIRQTIDWKGVQEENVFAPTFFFCCKLAR